MSWTSTVPMRLVGDRFELVPAQSAFGCLVRIARLNQIAPTNYRSVIGLYARRSDDLHHLLSTSPRRRQALATALKLELPHSWDPAVWKPYCEHQVVRAGTSPFRYCMACIRVGYHCELHQLPWIDSCPWHCIRLRTGCPRCGGALATSTGAGRKLLTCLCGMDLINVSAAARLGHPLEGAKLYLDEYLTWAGTMRKCQVLVGVSPQEPCTVSLRQLVQLPDTLRRSACSPPLKYARSYRHGLHAGRLSPTEDARRLLAFRDSIPKMLHLPGFMADCCDGVVQEVARSMPPGSLNAREQILFLGRDGAAQYESADRETSAIVTSLPPWTLGADRFLNLQSVHPICARFLVNLEDAFENAVPGLLHGTDCRALGVLRRTQSAVLVRHYAEGLRAILARHAPQLYSNYRRRLKLSIPLALVRFDITSVRVTFTPLTRYEDPNDLLAASRILK